jgi:hypothetical protein
VSIDIVRSTHPDLLEETLAAAEQAEPAATPAAPPARRGGGRARSEPQPPPVPDSTPTPAEPPASADGEAGTEPPEWLASAREAVEKGDASTLLDLLVRNVPREELERHDVVSGLIGHKADALLQKREQQRQQQEREQRKLAAAQNNDLYTLGEMTQEELAQRLQDQAAARAAGPFMDGVVLFQQQLPEAVQRLVAGKTFGEGKGQAAGVAEYLQFLTTEAVKLGVDSELKRRESALRKSVLSEVNGDEPVPERESGTPGRVREVTDEQIGRMTLQQYEALFDENGHPRPGVRHRPTRSVPLRQQ